MGRNILINLCNILRVYIISFVRKMRSSSYHALICGMMFMLQLRGGSHV